MTNSEDTKNAETDNDHNLQSQLWDVFNLERGNEVEAALSHPRGSP